MVLYAEYPACPGINPQILTEMLVERAVVTIVDMATSITDRNTNFSWEYLRLPKILCRVEENGNRI